MNNILLLISQQFRTNSSHMLLHTSRILLKSEIIRKKLKRDVKSHMFQNMTPLETSLRDVVAIKICCFRYKIKKQKPVTSKEQRFVLFAM